MCPALDALVLLLKSKMPSMKKKGQAPAAVKEMSATLFEPLKLALKNLAGQFDTVASVPQPDMDALSRQIKWLNQSEEESKEQPEQVGDHTRIV